MEPSVKDTLSCKEVLVAFSLAAIATLWILFICVTRDSPYDYTLRIAQALLQGQVGVHYKPPSWLNEFVPAGEIYYSVFPLGSVLSMLPVALLVKLGLPYRTDIIAALLFAGMVAALFLLSAISRLSLALRIWLTVAFTLGSWHWVNLCFGGAWQLALGFGVSATVMALLFATRFRSPYLSGFFFALAFGNRSEILITAPLVMMLLVRQKNSNERWRDLYEWVQFPIALGIMTMLYNHLRFGSIFDFGYAHIPGVLDEPWYQQGIFSLSAIENNFKEMLLVGWQRLKEFPYFKPTGFGGSIILASPFLLWLLRRPVRDHYSWILAWLAIIGLTIILWSHGNPGGWQYSYRYAAVLLPWFALVAFSVLRERERLVFPFLVSLSVIINLWGGYLFLWNH
jgi:hypothetical protein